MSETNLAAVNDLIQKVWAPLAGDILQKGRLLSALVNRSYEGQIRQKNDTVKVSVIKQLAGGKRTVGVDSDTFETETIQYIQVDLKADKRAYAAVEIDDLVDLQSQLEGGGTLILDNLMNAAMDQIEDECLRSIGPLSANLKNSVSAYQKSQINEAKKLLAKQRVPFQAGAMFGLLDPEYMEDFRGDTNLTTSDQVNDQVVVSGLPASPRFGINFFEHNYMKADSGIVFHRDFLNLATQKAPQIEVVSLKSQKKFKYMVVLDTVFGVKLHPQGDKMHVVHTAAASGSQIYV